MKLGSNGIVLEKSKILRSDPTDLVPVFFRVFLFFEQKITIPGTGGGDY